MNENKYTRADIAKTITDAGVERAISGAWGHWNKGHGKPAQCTIPAIWQR